MNKREKADYAEAAEMQGDMEEASSGEIARDIDMTQHKQYPSGIIPQDLYQYKRMRMQPESSADFPGQIDKDWVLANISGDKPNLQQKKFEVGTYQLVKSIFVKKAMIPLLDKDGEPVLINGKPAFFEGKIFDDAFQPVADYLLSSIKSELVGSRGMGGDREAVLDITTGFRKQVEKKRTQEGKILGMGGNQ
jgi:hypothetical protein